MLRPYNGAWSGENHGSVRRGDGLGKGDEVAAEVLGAEFAHAVEGDSLLSLLKLWEESILTLAPHSPTEPGMGKARQTQTGQNQDGIKRPLKVIDLLTISHVRQFVFVLLNVRSNRHSRGQRFIR